MNSHNNKIVSIFLFLTLLLFLFSNIAHAKTVVIEAHWPAGVGSHPKTRDISVKGPCQLVMKVWIHPFYKDIGGQVCWNNATNSIPPFPLGKGKVEARTWENGVLVDSNGDLKTGSKVYSETRFRITEKGPYGGKVYVIPPQRRNLAGAFVDQYKQYMKVTFEVYPLNAKIPWGKKLVETSPGIGGTSWSVGGHPVHWVFHKNGIVEAPGLWKGTWTKISGGYHVKLSHKGATDSFVIKLSSDGRSFVAYKNRKVYRKGIRVK